MTKRPVQKFTNFQNLYKNHDWLSDIRTSVLWTFCMLGAATCFSPLGARVDDFSPVAFSSLSFREQAIYQYDCLFKHLYVAKQESAQAGCPLVIVYRRVEKHFPHDKTSATWWTYIRVRGVSMRSARFPYWFTRSQRGFHTKSLGHFTQNAERRYSFRQTFRGALWVLNAIHAVALPATGDWDSGA